MVIEGLEDGVKEFSKSAEEEDSKGRLRSSAVLYFKAIADLCDIIIYLRLRKIPDNHEERFRLLERCAPNVYNLLHSTFQIYTKTYRKNLSKEEHGRLKDVFKRVKEIAEQIKGSA